jgi:hypothetical protein
MEVKAKCAAIVGPDSAPLVDPLVLCRGNFKSRGAKLLKLASNKTVPPRHPRAASPLHLRLRGIAENWSPTVSTFTKSVQKCSDSEISDCEDFEQHGQSSWVACNPKVVLHHGTECAGCAEEPIVERCYHCDICAVDLCEICVARGVNDPTHILSCHFQSVEPKPSLPVRFAQKEIISHSGRRLKDRDCRKFLVRYCGYYWADEEQSAENVTLDLSVAYDQKETRKKLRRRYGRVFVFNEKERK